MITRNRKIEQILQNTQDIMKHFGLTQTDIISRLNDLTETVYVSEDRLSVIEQTLIEHGVLKSGQLVVPAADAVRLAASEDMTVRELYQLLTDRGIIQPSADRTSTVMRINGACVRVVRIGRNV